MQSETTIPAPHGAAGFPAPATHKALGALLLAYFVFRLVYFALNISPFAPPDEVTHAGLCRVFSKALFLPANSADTYEYGLVTNIPSLYYWVMGKLLHLNVFGMRDLVFLRLLNIPIALGVVSYARRTLRLLTRDGLADLLLLAVMTNTMMFSFLSASVSYDNLTTLWAAMAIYYLFAFLKGGSGWQLAASLACQMAGCLTKVSFLPLALILTLVLCAARFRELGSLPAALGGYLRGCGIRGWLLVLAFLAGLALNLALYGGNQLRYGYVLPSMAQVLGERVAMQHRISARSLIFDQYRQGKLSYMEALQLTGTMSHPGDKSDTFFLLMTNENLKRDPRLWMGPGPYLGFWFENMLATTLGIKGHLAMFKPLPQLLPFALLLVLALVGLALRWRPHRDGWLAPGLAAVVLVYAGYLLVRVNYDAYRYFGAPGMTLQGRYLFPVLAPLYALSCHYLLALFGNARARLGVALAVALFFMVHDFPWFLSHATPEWFA